MTEPTLQQRIDRLTVEFMGWRKYPEAGGWFLAK